MLNHVIFHPIEVYTFTMYNHLQDVSLLIHLN